VSVIIIGGGEIGRFIAEKLIEEDQQVVIIEKNERLADELAEELDAKIVVGNGASPGVLREAGIGGADLVLAVTNSDEVNLLATLLAGIKAPQAKRIARIREPEFDIQDEAVRKKLDVDLVINPDREAAETILRILEVPGALEMTDFFDGRLKLVGAKVRRSSELVGKPLREFKELGEGGPCLMAAILRNQQIVIPSGETKLMPDDEVYFAAEADRVQEGLRILGHRGEKTGSVLIQGGGFIGMHLASALERRGVNVKIAEKDTKLCSQLSRSLDKAVILHAEATDQDFLEEENIDRMDAFIAVTKDDEDNILSALLAKRMGCHTAITLSHNRAYMKLLSRLDIDVVVNPRQLASNTILHFIRKGKVLHASSILDLAEFIEVEALATSAIVKKPISDLGLPKGVIILSIRRGEGIMVPHGATVVEPGDRLLMIARRESIDKLEKMITVGMEYF
jgi:trk system potassium uptake protein TrkA